MSGFSDGAGPGGQTGRCLFGIGIGHAADVLILSRLSVGVNGCGEEDRVCPEGIGRGRAMVAMFFSKCVASATPTGFAMYFGAACKELCGRRSYPNCDLVRNEATFCGGVALLLRDKKMVDRLRALVDRIPRSIHSKYFRTSR